MRKALFLVMATSTLTREAPSTDRLPFWELFTLFIAPAFIFANMYTTQAILPIFSQTFAIDAPTASLTMSVLVLAVAIGSLFYGPLSDLIGRKPVMVYSSLLVAIPTLLCSIAPNFTVLVICRALQGLFMPGLTSVAIAYVNEEFSTRWRGLAMGIYFSGLVFGGLVARVGSATLASLFDWHIAMSVFVIPTIIAAFVMWKFLPSHFVKPPKREVSALLFLGQFARNTGRDMWGHLHNRRLIGTFVIGCMSFFGFTGTFTFLPYYLTGPAFHLSTMALSMVYLLWLTGLFSPIAGTLAMRIGSRKVIAFSTITACIGLLFTLSANLPIVMIGLGFLTLGMYTTGPAANIFLGKQAKTARGSAASLYLSLYYFGASLGAVLPGLLLNTMGWPGVVLLCLGTTLIALLADAFLCR